MYSPYDRYCPIAEKEIGTNNFGNGRHTYGVSSKNVEHLVFCRSLEGRSLCTDIYHRGPKDRRRNYHHHG